MSEFFTWKFSFFFSSKIFSIFEKACFRNVFVEGTFPYVATHLSLFVADVLKNMFLISCLTLLPHTPL